MRNLILFLIFTSLPFLAGCSSYEKFKYITEEFEMPSSVFASDYNQTWKAVLEVMKKYDLSLQSVESGVIKTRWMDNTREINFVEAFGKSDSVKAAKFKLVINVAKGFRGGGEVAKVTIYRRQLIEQDFLQGWKEIPSDGIQEKVLLYRIGRLIAIDKKISTIEQARIKEQSQDF